MTPSAPGVGVGYGEPEPASDGVDAAARTAASQAAAAAAAAQAELELEEARALAAEDGKLAKAANLSDLASAAAARGNLGLGSAATHPVTDFEAAGSVAAAIAALVNSAPGALDTLKEIADQLAADESAVAGIISTLATKVNANAVDPKTNVRIITAAGAVTAADGDVLFMDTTLGNQTVTLPAATTAGRRVSIKKIDASLNTISVTGTIDGAVNPTIRSQWNGLEVIADGTAWKRQVRPTLDGLANVDLSTMVDGDVKSLVLTKANGKVTAAPGSAGSGVTDRGSWAATTAYAKGDRYTDPTGLRRDVTTAYTSGGTFGSTDTTNTSITGSATTVASGLDATMASNIVTVPVTTHVGVSASTGRAYYDPAGPVAGEEAVLTITSDGRMHAIRPIGAA